VSERWNTRCSRSSAAGGDVAFHRASSSSVGAATLAARVPSLDPSSAAAAPTAAGAATRPTPAAAPAAESHPAGPPRAAREVPCAGGCVLLLSKLLSALLPDPCRCWLARNALTEAREAAAASDATGPELKLLRSFAPVAAAVAADWDTLGLGVGLGVPEGPAPVAAALNRPAAQGCGAVAVVEEPPGGGGGRVSLSAAAARSSDLRQHNRQHKTVC
jgi:hypothetical protein